MQKRILFILYILFTTKVLYSQQSNIVKNYIDPSSTTNFKEKNNCIISKDFPNTLVCHKKVDDISYKVFLSLSLDTLKKINENSKPNENEIYYFFQQLENRDYDFDKEERPKRFMAFSIPDKLRKEFKQKKVYDLKVIEVLEHKFWNISDFSGMTAFKYLEEEIAK